MVAVITGVVTLLFGFSAGAQTTNTLSNAEIQGRRLVQKILAQWPSENLTNTGVLIIHGGHGHRSKTPVEFRTTVGASGWATACETTTASNRVALVIIHKPGQPNQYELFHRFPMFAHSPRILSGNHTMIPFAGSDFWVADLGLEFFHWPDQRILKPYEMRRGRSCKVLESINPDPSAKGYSRVVSWIDNETLGIVQAKAYDANGKLLKEFYPKDFKKVKGQWELGEMEMINNQTGSRSWIKFDLKNRH